MLDKVPKNWFYLWRTIFSFNERKHNTLLHLQLRSQQILVGIINSLLNLKGTCPYHPKPNLWNTHANTLPILCWPKLPVLSVQIRSKISKCSWNSIILPNTLNLGAFEGINGTCRTLQRPANSRCYCSCDWCLLLRRRWVVFIFHFALSVKKIYHGKLNAIDRYNFPCISLA